MLLKILKGKIHRATVTEADLSYTGSIGIDADLMKACGLVENEYVEIYNITNGERFNTYAFSIEGGSGAISINGAAAHKASPGDNVIICAYALMEQEEAEEHKPSLVFVDETNEIKEVK